MLLLEGMVELCKLASYSSFIKVLGEHCNVTWFQKQQCAFKTSLGTDNQGKYNNAQMVVFYYNIS